MTTPRSDASSMEDPPRRNGILGSAIMRTVYTAAARRRVLCIYPAYARSFGTFQHAYGFFGGRVRAFMPPQGLLAVAAYLPASWEVRFVDENSRATSDDDFRWADAVFVSGMHVQRPWIHDVIARAHAHDRMVVLGGPSVSGCPEYYPDADVLHVGELGDATDRLIAYLDHHVERPPEQLRFETVERLPLADFPTPAYDQIPLREYFIANIQFSSGCPYACEFCDIPALYGRNPRLKTPEQICRELDVIEPAALYARFAHQVEHTFTRRRAFPTNAQRASWANVRMGLAILGRLVWKVGVRGDYRRTFWRLAWPALKAGRIEALIHVAVVSHHLIEFTRDCVRGVGESSFYAPGATPPLSQADAPR